MIKESIKEHARKAMAEARIDIDVEYCKKHNITFPDHNPDKCDIEDIDLETISKSAKASFDYLTKIFDKK